MISFKKFLINEAIAHESMDRESILILHKIMDMIDNAHVDHTDDSISFAVGKVIHDKKYNNFHIIIKKSDKNEVHLGRHKTDERHALMIETTNLPERGDISSFLSKEEMIKSFKAKFGQFMNDAVIDDTKDHKESRYEATNRLNDNSEFEKLYSELVQKLNELFGQYTQAKKYIEKKMSQVSDDLGEKEILKSSAARLKKDYLGSSVEEFKNKAKDLLGKDKFKLLNKEYREKLEKRLESFYDSKVD
jgi:hypothetical protein